MKFKSQSCVYITILVLLLAVVSSMCINPNEPPASESHLRVALAYGPDKTLDPAEKWTGWYMREVGVYETLFSHDENMNLVPELAKSYEKMTDTEWSIQLRDNVYFHDGKKMTADDVIFSIKRVLDPKNSRSSEYDFIESIEKQSENEIKIKTKKIYAPTIASLSDPLVSIISSDATDIAKKPVGTGPFKFKNFVESVSLDLVQHPDYWKGKPGVDKLTIYFIPDGTSRLFKLEAGEVDMAMGIPQSEVETLKKSGKYTVDSKETLRTYFLYLNTKKEPLNNIALRKAINYGINRSQIVEKALDGIGGTPALGIFPASMEWSYTDPKLNENNEKEIRELLEGAGFKDTDNDGYLEYNGKKFELGLLTYTSRPQLKPSAEVIITQLEKLGIKSKLTILQSGAIENKMAVGDYDMALYAWGVAPVGDPDYFISKHFLSTSSEAKKTGFSNKRADELVKMGVETLDKDKRKEYYKEIQQIVTHEIPEICVFHQNSILGASNKVKGIQQYPSEVTIITHRLSIEE